MHNDKYHTKCPKKIILQGKCSSVLKVFFSRKSDSTITNVCPFIRPSVRHKSKPINSLKSSYCIIHPSSFIILHSSFITLHSSFLHFVTFKLFSLFLWILGIGHGRHNRHHHVKVCHLGPRGWPGSNPGEVFRLITVVLV